LRLSIILNCDNVKLLEGVLMANKIRVIYVALFAFVVLGIAPGAISGDYTGAKVTEIRKATITAGGQKIKYPETDNAEVTALLVEIPPGGETGWHFHPVPVYAYVLSGTLTSEMQNGWKHDYKEGEAIFEAVNIAHNGKNLGKIPVKLVVFYTGEVGKPLTIRVH
jgi:quercetin dioxygenase-like cupin family protein